MRIEPILGVGLLALVVLSGPWAQKPATKEARLGDQAPAEGSAAPDFTLPSSEGGSLSLHDLKGRIVVLYFYPKDDTPHCTKEACSFRDASAEFKKMGVAVVGISKDDLQSHERFKKKYGLDFPLLSDHDGSVIAAYGCWKKSIFGRTALGLDRSTFVIDREGIIRKIWRGVNVNGHEEEVMEFVRSLG
jgi:peroxiredoxin Q/BCP